MCGRGGGEIAHLGVKKKILIEKGINSRKIIFGGGRGGGGMGREPTIPAVIEKRLTASNRLPSLLLLLVWSTGIFK